jgi:transcriptional regulator with XRE-family HTH domain
MAVMAPPRKPVDWPKRLKDLRTELGLTQVQAAARADVAASTWIAWENAQRKPNRFTLQLLRTAFPGRF